MTYARRLNATLLYHPLLPNQAEHQLFERYFGFGYPEPFRLFDACVALFEMLDAADAARDEHELAFTVRLAALLGFAPRVDRCARCGAIAPDGKAALFDPRASSVVCRACGGAPLKLSGATRRLLSALGTDGWTDLAHTEWPAAARDEVRRVAQGLVASHLVRS